MAFIGARAWTVGFVLSAFLFFALVVATLVRFKDFEDTRDTDLSRCAQDASCDMDKQIWRWDNEPAKMTDRAPPGFTGFLVGFGVIGFVMCTGVSVIRVLLGFV